MRKRDTRMEAGCAFWSGIPPAGAGWAYESGIACESRTRVRMEGTRARLKHACSSRSIKIY